jgi:hypothetical protein
MNIFKLTTRLLTLLIIVGYQVSASDKQDLNFLSDKAKKLYSQGKLTELTTLKEDGHFGPKLIFSNFYKLLEKDKQIKKLDYTGVKIGDNLLTLYYLKKNTTLKVLKLNHPDLSDGSGISSRYNPSAGIKYLAELIEKNETLETIEMNFNYLPDGGMKIISESLKKNKNLQTLSLEGNYIEEEGKKYLYDAVRYRYFEYGHILNLNLDNQDSDLKNDFPEFKNALVNIKKFL